MSRLRHVDPKEVDPACKDLFDDFIRERGAVPNMFRILAQVPDIRGAPSTTSAR